MSGRRYWIPLGTRHGMCSLDWVLQFLLKGRTGHTPQWELTGVYVRLLQLLLTGQLPQRKLTGTNLRMLLER